MEEQKKETLEISKSLEDTKKQVKKELETLEEYEIKTLETLETLEETKSSFDPMIFIYLGATLFGAKKVYDYIMTEEEELEEEFSFDKIKKE